MDENPFTFGISGAIGEERGGGQLLMGVGGKCEGVEASGDEKGEKLLSFGGVGISFEGSGDDSSFSANC